MKPLTLNGDQALAYGALFSGVKLVTSYPGSPSSGTMHALVGLAARHDFYIEWSSNEKVAMEMGIGASIAGRRALVCTKNVGMNVLVDPLMTFNITPVNGGLVILLGDDPGAYGSQNDQDTRSLALLLGMPVLEPAGPAEALVMMQEAFEISEQYETVVIIRITRSFTQQTSNIPSGSRPVPVPDRGLVREPGRYTPTARDAVEKHRQLNQRLKNLNQWVEQLSYNKRSGKGKKGIIAAGFCYWKLMEVIGPELPDAFRVFKLGIHYPLPGRQIADFLAGCESVLVLEENSDFVALQVKAIAHENKVDVSFWNDQKVPIPREGELYRWQIAQLLSAFEPTFEPYRHFLKEEEQSEWPVKKNNCHGCQYDVILDHLEVASKELGQRPVLIGDPGCLFTVADRLDAKIAMGSAVAIANGLSKAGIGERAVALFGDSSFFHTAISAICNAVHNESDILMILLDNKAARTTGHQANPGVGANALGHPAPSLDMVAIAEACGVRRTRRYRLHKETIALREVFSEALKRRELEMIVVEIEPVP